MLLHHCLYYDQQYYTDIKKTLLEKEYIPKKTRHFLPITYFSLLREKLIMTLTTETLIVLFRFRLVDLPAVYNRNSSCYSVRSFLESAINS